MGMEKLIARFSHIPSILRVLARSATGQKATSYVSFITGPRAGKKSGSALRPELHVVLLDNGRSRILRDPAMREALRCIRCGACLNACPVYQSIGGHAYGWVYPGPIGSVVSPLLLGLREAGNLAFASSLCASCAEICPVGIDLPRLLLELRNRYADGTASEPGRSSWIEKLLFRLWAFFVGGRARYRFAARAARLLQKPLVRKGTIRRLPFPFSKWTQTRDFPAVAGKTFHSLWRERKKKHGKG
jgi:L-lactate dehydrogenase complex protein LldF